MTTVSYTLITIPACSLVPLIICFLFWIFARFLTILLPVVLELCIYDYLASEPCLNKDNILCILPALNLVPYSDVTLCSCS